MEILKCPDCEYEIIVDDDVGDNDVYTCPSCGLELEYVDGKLIELTIEGEDWGE